MLNDGLKFLNENKNILVKDIAELIAEAIN